MDECLAHRTLVPRMVLCQWQLYCQVAFDIWFANTHVVANWFGGRGVAVVDFCAQASLSNIA